MNLLTVGLDKRIIEVTEMTSKDERVLNAEVLIDKYIKMIEELLPDKTVMFPLEDAINQVRLAEAEVGYRIGVTDGMQLQQEVNAIRKGGWQ